MLCRAQLLGCTVTKLFGGSPCVSPALVRQMSDSVPSRRLDVLILSELTDLRGQVQKLLDAKPIADSDGKLIEVALHTPQEGPSRYEPPISQGDAQIVLADPDKVDLRRLSSLKWLQSTWAGVNPIMKQISESREKVSQTLEKRDDLETRIRAKEVELTEVMQKLKAALLSAEPLIAEALEAVGKISKLDLEELRTLSQPPPGVRMCIEAVHLVLSSSGVGEGMANNAPATDWDLLRRLTRRPDFIQSVLNFNGKLLQHSIVKIVQRRYLGNPTFTFEAINRCNKACGPLYKWLVAQMSFCDVLGQEVVPLEIQRDELEEQIRLLKAQLPDQGLDLSFDFTRLGGVMGPHMCEYVLSYILARERFHLKLAGQQEAKEWKGLVYRPLKSLTIGILGIGDIGSAVAKGAKTFGMKVYGLSRRPRDDLESIGLDKWYSFDQLGDLLKASDYIVNILPSTDQTKGMLSGRVMTACKRSAVFINVGRGDIIDEETMITALTQKWISGMVCDVFNTEPLPKSSKLWTLPGMTITPHVAALSLPAEVAERFHNQLQRWQGGEGLSYQVDKVTGY